VYDALVSERPYKQPFTHEKAVEIIKSDSGTHFDPNLVEVFLGAQEIFRFTAQEFRVNSEVKV
jgi:HD-GYP domain-containing protein (c-di-GMP phosphodiesterase class II)